MRAMTCRELADFLLDYVNEDLPSDVRQSFDRHLTLCPNCVAYVRAYRTTIDGKDYWIAKSIECAGARTVLMTDSGAPVWDRK